MVLKIDLYLLKPDRGIISESNGSYYTIRQVTSKMGYLFSVGDNFDLCDTYCATVVKEDKTISYIQVGIIPKMIIHPVYNAIQLESYIGAPIHDHNGSVTGTVNFSSNAIRNEDFDNSEIQLIEQMARKLGDVLYQ